MSGTTGTDARREATLYREAAVDRIIGEAGDAVRRLSPEGRLRFWNALEVEVRTQIGLIERSAAERASRGDVARKCPICGTGLLDIQLSVDRYSSSLTSGDPIATTIDGWICPNCAWRGARIDAK